ncbi:MAG TPA: gliding motility-associated protein GldE [Bacteroidales bacterium]|nr:gliding motility-associated protein GldE [Bacteroidales bacterium]
MEYFLSGHHDTLLILSVIQTAGWHMILNLTILFAILAVLLVCSALMSGSEVAYFSLSPGQLNELESGKSPADQLAIKLLEQPKRLLATILIANNFLNVAIVILSTYITNSFIDISTHPVIAFVVQVIVVTSLILLIGDIIPKVYATINPVRHATFMSKPLSVIVSLLHPLSYILTTATNIIDKRMENRKYSITMEDLSDAIDITADGNTNEDDRKILKSITKFGDITVREIMRPRIDVTAIEITEPFSQVIKVVVDSGYSRIPTYDETPDKVTGILYIKDLLPHLDSGADFEWTKLVRSAFFVPENKPIDELLEEFQSRKMHMAIVVDEYGGTSGIVTMEDIIEEIVGDINDEFDSDSDGATYTQIDENTYVFEGKTLLNDFCKIAGISDSVFEEAKGESDTLAGLLLELAGKIPRTNERFTYGDFDFRIEAADRRRIKRVKVIINRSEESTGE